MTWPVSWVQQLRYAVGDNSVQHIIHSVNNPTYRQPGPCTSVRSTIWSPLYPNETNRYCTDFQAASRFYKPDLTNQCTSTPNNVQPATQQKNVATKVLLCSPNDKNLIGYISVHLALSTSSFSSVDEISLASPQLPIRAMKRCFVTEELLPGRRGGNPMQVNLLS